MNGVHLRCTRCWCLVAPAEASCAGCGASFSQEEVKRAMGEATWTERHPAEKEPVE